MFRCVCVCMCLRSLVSRCLHAVCGPTSPLLAPTAACLEESLHHETTRGGALEAQWKTTKATLDALILDGDVDIVGGRHAPRDFSMGGGRGH